MIKLSYTDRTTIRVLFLTSLALLGIPYYFLNGGTLEGFLLIRLVGHLIGYFAPIAHHRWLSHNHFEPTFTGKCIMSLSLVSSGIGDPLQIVAGHRIHHAHSDTENDIHSPRYLSAWRMWLGRFTEPKVTVRPPKDFFRNPWAVFLHNHYWKLFYAFNLLIFLVFDLKTMLIFCPINFVYAWTLTNLGVNYLGHYDSNTKTIEARNTNRFLVLLSAGETLQKNHHDHPSKPNLSGNGQTDPALWLVNLISKKT